MVSGYMAQTVAKPVGKARNGGKTHRTFKNTVFILISIKLKYTERNKGNFTPSTRQMDG